MTRREWMKAVPREHRVLMLRTCASDMTARGGFTWPRRGYVEAPDWTPEPMCGGGLHGALRGEGDGALLSWAPDAAWLVVEVDAREVVDLAGKAKAPRGWVVYAGDRGTATARMQAAYPGAVVIGGTATVGYGGTATAGYDGTATAGDRGTATVGYRGTATAGYRGTATVGYRGTATAGYGGHATAGYGGHATAGHDGTATAGYRGTATAGDRGTATAGDRGTATAGYYGQIRVEWWDAASSRRRVAVGYVGEDGIVAGVAYRCDDTGRLVPAK